MKIILLLLLFEFFLFFENSWIVSSHVELWNINCKITMPLDSKWYGFQLSSFYGYHVLKFQIIWLWKISSFQVLVYLVINLWLSTFKLLLLLFVFLVFNFLTYLVFQIFGFEVSIYLITKFFEYQVLITNLLKLFILFGFKYGWYV
jgi:hypothetical protein